MEQNKTYALALLAAALVLLALCTAGLEGRPLEAPVEAAATRSVARAAVNRFGPLFSVEPFDMLLRTNGHRDVFATTHFNKPPPPASSPPKPKTRSVELTFMGTLRSSDGELSAFLRVDTEVSKVTPGARVAPDWGVAAVNRSFVVVTNAAQTNQIDFQQTLKLTVPIP